MQKSQFKMQKNQLKVKKSKSSVSIIVKPQPRFGRARRETALTRKNVVLQLEDSTSSSSSSLAESTDSYVYMQEDIEEEHPLHMIYDTDNESDTEEDEPEYIQCKPLESVIDFFHNFSDIPSLENISVDASLPSIKPYIKPEIVETSLKDVGKFVHPLTGEGITSSEESKSTDNDAEPMAAAEEQEEESEVSEEQSEDWMLPEYEVVEEIKPVTSADHTFQAFMEMESQAAAKVEADIEDWDKIAREEEALRVKQKTLKFLTDLISQAVDTVEYISPEGVLRQNLDNFQLVQELIHKINSLDVERNVQTFLKRKIVQYFRIKKSFRPILPDNPKTVTQDKLKYKDAIKRLDHLLEMESKLKSTIAETMKNLKEEHNQAKENAETQIQRFENLVKQTLYRENNPRSLLIIENLLSKMNKDRYAVNEVRFEMIIKQHTRAQLMEALRKLEDLGNGLSMREFGSLQAETTTLGKKIEERNSELNRLHKKCHTNIHTMANFKEKQEMLLHNIAIQKTVLETVSNEKQMIRARVHRLKLQHENVRNQIKELSFQEGLLDKPLLLMDFDASVKVFHKQKAINNDLKESLLLTQQKIDHIEKGCI